MRLVVLGMLVAVPAQAATVALQWDSADDTRVVGYVVRFGIGQKSYTGYLDVRLGTRFEVTNLEAGLTYCFTVQSYDVNGMLSEFAGEVCTKTPKGNTPAPKPAPQPQPVVRKVSTSAELQSALDKSESGDSILLEAGVTFVGNFVLPQKSTLKSFITIRSSAADAQLPASGARMTPQYSGKLPKLRSPNSSPALATAPGAHHFRLQFLEFLANAKGIGEIIALGDGTSEQSTISSVPYEIVLDRLYIHGDAKSGQERGIAINSRSTDILNSYISDIKAIGRDAQGIAGWNGPGDWVISNNYIEAAGVNVLIGGAPASIPELVPTDIALTRNELTKQMTWKTQSWGVKNLLEIQQASRVTVDGNLFDNLWPSSQNPYAVALRPVSFDGEWTSISDVEFTNNIIRDVTSAILLSDESTEAISHLSGVSLRNNFFDKVDPAIGQPSNLVLVRGGEDLTFDHNTVVSEHAFGIFVWRASPRFTFTNNVLVNTRVPVFALSTSAGVATIKQFFPQSEFAGGMFVGTASRQYPVLNFYPSTIAMAGFVNYAKGDYRLSAQSIYGNSATDGDDPGCDFTALAAARQ